MACAAVAAASVGASVGGGGQLGVGVGNCGEGGGQSKFEASTQRLPGISNMGFGILLPNIGTSSRHISVKETVKQSTEVS